MNVGIVDLDGVQQTPSCPWYRLPLQWHGYDESASPTPGSLCRRGLAREVRLRKKIIPIHNKCILYVYLLQLLPPLKRWCRTSPALPPRSHLLSVPFFIAPACFWLVVECEIIERWPSKATIEYVFHFSCSNPQTMGRHQATHSTPATRPL